MSSDIGGWFEDKVKDALEKVQSRKSALYYRFPDSKAARNYLPAQPGDHLLAIDGIPILIEEKCSLVHGTLRSGMSSLWSKKQAAQHRKWHRAECSTWVMFCDYRTRAVEIWSGNEIAMFRAKGLKIPKGVEPIICGHIDTLYENILWAIGHEKEIKHADNH